MNPLGKLRLVLADTDEDYIGSLEKYIMCRHSSRFEISSFTEPERFREQAETGMLDADILLAGEAFIGFAPVDATKTVLLLDDGKSGHGARDAVSIYRYQHAEKLITAILGKLSAGSSGSSSFMGGNGTLAVCFISSEGGSGRSVIAAGCSILSSRRCLKPFYLNLEKIPSTSLFFQGDSEQSFSNVIYYLKSREENLEMKLAGAKCTDTSNGVDFFLQQDSLLESSLLQPSDLERLITGLKSSSLYDVLFVDMPAGVDENTAAVINACDRIVLICGTGPASAHKFKTFEKEFGRLEKRLVPGLSEKMLFVLNDRDNSGTGSNSFFKDRDRTAAISHSRMLGTMTDRVDPTNCEEGFTAGLAGLLERLDRRFQIKRTRESGE